MKNIYIISVLLLTFIVPEVLARPEYALQLRSNRCTTCHTNPTGGGHRNLTGKAFGPKAAALESFSQQDVFGFDFRTILYTPVQKEDREKKTSGMGIMAALPSISVPFKKNDSGQEWRLVYSHNIGGFGGISPHDAYLRVQLYEDYRFYPQYIIVGRFSAPFGLMDDEHRTYIRQQTKTTWNDKDMGILLSGDWSHMFHYDLAIVNGEQTAGTDFGTDRLALWSGIANLRFLFNFGWMVGVSGSYTNNEKHSSAVSVYQNLSLGSLTGDLLSGNLIAEAVLGYKMNHRVPNAHLFAPVSKRPPWKSYLDKVKDSNSFGYKVQLNYNILPAWKLIFKYDHLLLDIDKTGDYYQRYGVGLRHFFNNQVSAQVRYEYAVATPKSEEASKIKSQMALQNIIWALLQVKI